MRYIIWIVFLVLLVSMTVHGQTPSDLLPITAENVDRLTQIQVLGRGGITALALSESEAYLAVGTRAGVWLYETANFSSEPIFFDNFHWVSAIDFSSDDSLMAVVGFNDAVTVWSVANHEVLWEFNESFNVSTYSESIIFSADGQTVTAAIGGQVINFDADTGREISRFVFYEDEARTEAFSLSSDGQFLAVAKNVETGKRIEMWDVRSGAVLWTATIETEYTFVIWSVAFHPHLPLVVFAAHNGEISVWDIESGQMVNQITESGGIPDMQFVDSGDGLVTLSVNGFVRLWNIANSEITTVVQSQIGFQYLAVTEDGTTIYAAGSDDRLYIFTRENQEYMLLEVRDEFGSSSSDPSLAYIPSEEVILTATGDDTMPYSNRIHAWSLESSQQMFTIPDFWFISDVSISGDYIIGRGLSINFWSYSTQELVFTLDEYEGDQFHATEIALNQSGNLLAIAVSSGFYGDGTSMILIWDIDQRQFVAETSIEVRYVENLTFHPVNNQLGFVASDIEPNRLDMMLWDFSENDMPYTVVSTAGAISALGGMIAFHPDGHLMAYYGEGDIHLYDFTDQTSTLVLDIPQNRYVIDVMFNPTGDLLAVGYLGYVGTTALVSLADRDNPTVMTYLPGGAAFSFTEDGTRLFTLEHDGVVWVWGVLPEE